MPEIIEKGSARLSIAIRLLLTHMKLELDNPVLRIKGADAGIKDVA